jgi:hypothetical protein
LNAAIELAEYLRDMGHSPEQVQDYYPTPGTLSTCMFYTEIDPRNMKPVYVPKTPKDKAMQRALLQYKKPSNYELVYEALKKSGRDDLIGFGPKCLIRPRRSQVKFYDKKNANAVSGEKKTNVKQDVRNSRSKTASSYKPNKNKNLSSRRKEEKRKF